MAENSLRPATREDFPAIRALIHAVSINPTGLDWRHFLIIVNGQGELVACGQIKVHGDGSRELASIAVREQDRGRGAAREIILALLRREPVRPLYLMCRSRLVALYAKFGFRKIDVEEMPPYFQRISRAERLFNAKAPPENRLAVMRLD